MKWLIVGILVLLSSAAIAQTLLGNCGLTNITGIQLSTGNIYCIPISTSCANKLDFSNACNSQYVGLF